MPPRSSSRRKSNKQTKKAKLFTATTQPNHYSSSAVQSQGEVDLKVLREQNGRSGNDSLRPNSEKCLYLVAQEKKKGFSVSAGHNEMEGSVEETKKVESQSEGAEVIGIDVEEVKSIVEPSGEVAAETQEGEDSNIVIENVEESVPVESEKVEETEGAFEAIIEAIKEPDDAESKQDENQDKVSLIPEETEERLKEKDLPPSEETNVLSSALADESSRETEAIETTEADEGKLASSENKDLSSVETNEGLKDSDFSVPPTDVVPRETEGTTIVKTDESAETKLPAEDVKVEESTVVQEPSKEEDAKESLQPSANVSAAETPSSTLQENTEIPTSTENQTTVSAARRQHSSWSSCCGLFDFLFQRRDDR